MTQEKFEKLVQQLEGGSKKNPSGYRFRVMALTLLGFAYIFFFLGLFLALLGFTIFYIWNDHFSIGSLKLAFITGSLSILTLKALFVRIDMPSGVIITPKDAPVLFETIRELQVKMQAPKIDVVVVDHHFNAAVAQIPRFGLFGKNKNVLIIGLPLLLGLSVDQFKAVLAHELGHVSKKDTQFGAWIYRLRRTWERLLISLMENEQFGTFIFKWFFKWYYPVFNAYTFVMARQQEYIADRFSAEATSPQIAGEALVQVHITGAFYEEEFFSALFDYAEKTGEVPSPLRLFATHVKQVNVKNQQNYLQQSLEMKTNVADTHPSLADRLQALGVEAKLPPALREIAADHFLADAPEFMQVFDQAWIEQMGEKLKQAVQEKKEAETRAYELNQKQEKTLDEYYELASHTYDLHGPKAATTIYEEMIRTFGVNEQTALAHLYLGRVFLDDDEQLGVSYIETAMQLEGRCLAAGLELLEGYYQYVNKTEEYQKLREKAVQWAETLQLKAEEQAKQEVDKQMAELQEDDTKTLQDYFEIAKKTYEVHGVEAAIPLYEEIINKFGVSEETSLAFEVLGEVYLNHGDERGVAYVEKAMELDWEYRQEGFEVLEEFYKETNNKFALKKIRDRAAEWEAILEEFEEETEDIFEDDHWIEHDLPQDLLEQIIAECSKISMIEEIYVVRKVTQTIPEAKYYIFGFQLNIPEDVDPEDYEDRFARRAHKWIPEEINSSVIVLNDDELFINKIQQVPNSLFYKRSKERVVM